MRLGSGRQARRLGYGVLIKVARFFNEAFWPHTWNTVRRAVALEEKAATAAAVAAVRPNQARRCELRVQRVLSCRQ